MKPSRPYRFKIASEEWEFEQIHRLNYRTFVEEIPQHQANRDNRLIDRFDRENTYVICLCGERLVGMLSVRDKRPFSLDEKLENLDSYLPPGRHVCEFRLLSVEPEHRNGVVFLGLTRRMAQYCMSRGYDLAVISGAVRQQRLYKHVGFVPFGPLVGAPEALYQPMYLTLESFDQKAETFLPATAAPEAPVRVNLLPGPVGIREEVRQAFAGLPVSHRSESFLAQFQRTRRRLCKLVGARRVEILLGSGTLANDAVAGQLSLLKRHGLILSNGEFGQRLVDHAARFRLSFETLEVRWGDAFCREEIERAIDERPSLEWLWAVHSETSTGVLNDLEMLKEVCGHRGIRLCVDCISSIGTVPVDLSSVYLASGVSGKGLGAFPGLSMVFHNHNLEPAPESLPRYLDLGFYATREGVPFTHSSNLLWALESALDRFTSTRPFKELVELSRWLRPQIHKMGFRIVAPDRHASPAVATIALPAGVSSGNVGADLEKRGYLLSYRSEYLLRRNWIQICLMGEFSREGLVPLLSALEELCVPVPGK